jgi:glycine betaine catabolism B
MEQQVCGDWPTGRWDVECVDIEPETHDVKTFHFRVRARKDGASPLCLHRPGQFVTLRFRHGEKLVPRSYTVSSSPSRPMLMTLTIKRDPNGLVSRFMHDRLEVWDVLPISGPSGSFDLVSARPRRNIVMLSGGSGITPLMSMLRYIHDTRAGEFDVTFLHAARSADDLIFRSELGLIARRSKVKLGFICERDAESGMDRGYLSRDLLERHAPDILASTVLTCGPAPFMAAVRAMLGEMGFDMAHYHEESFGDPAERQNPEGAKPESLTPDFVSTKEADGAEPVAAEDGKDASTETDVASEIHFTLTGKSVSYEPGQTILDVASSAGIAIPTNCQMGLCGTCKQKCLGGVVKMDDTEGLEPGEEELGMVLTCCGRPVGTVSIEL